MCQSSELFGPFLTRCLLQYKAIGNKAVDNIHFLSVNKLLAISARVAFVEIYHFDDPATSDHGLVPKARFGLPSLAPGCRCCFRSGHSYPIAGIAHKKSNIPSCENSL